MLEGPTAAPLRVLIIDDEKNIRATLRLCLEDLGARVFEAPSAEAARALALREELDLAFVDLRLGPSNGLALLPPLLAQNPLLEIVVITAHGTIEDAVEAIQLGARNVLQKPFTPQQIRAFVDKVTTRRTLESRLRDLRSQMETVAPEIELETRCPRMRQLLGVLAKAAQHDVSVLLCGENGTGKSVLARHLHLLSARSAGPFVVVNCPTLSEELLASELFGHARGAFTGAVRDQPGRVEAAEGGTLFLDEIGELPSSMQAKLLRFLQDRVFERVGESQTRSANIRVVAATNRDLEAEVAAGRFREDLLFRLNTFELIVPPLRERAEDIVPLAQRFLAFFGQRADRPIRHELTKPAEEVLQTYAWPGNLRELHNTMERAAILASGIQIGPELFPERIPARVAVQLGGPHTLDDIEREHIQRVLARTATIDEAAQVLGVDSSTLWRRRKRYEAS